MKKNLFTCFLASLCLYGSPSTAQVADSPGADFLHRSVPQLSPEQGDTHRGGATRSDTLSIGDQIPSGIEFSEVLQYDSDRLGLDDYRGKYLILQFWAPSCSASIGSLPKMKQLNEKFGDKIQILPITVFSEEKIRETLEDFPTLGALDMPLVVNDQLMFDYFPHSVIPHFVIVSPEGEVLAVTGLEDMTEENLDLLARKNQLPFRSKSDTEIHIDPDSRLISENPGITNKNIWFQSAFTGYIPEVSGSLIQNYNEFSHIRIVNLSLIYHYRLAYSERSMTDYFGRNRIVTEGFRPEELTTDRMGLDYSAWKAEGDHVFGYELIAPIHLDPYVLMREDLRRFVPHIQATVENQNRTVLALVHREGEDYPESTADEKSYKSGSKGVEMLKYPLDGFVYHLNAMFLRNSPIPVINRTGIDYPIDLSLDARLSDVESIRTALRKNGFDLIEREEEIPVLVLRKIDPSKLTGL